MANDTVRTSEATDSPTPDDPVESVRMSFGDHLEELRSCLIRALVGVAAGTAVSLFFGKGILSLICRPLLIAQRRNGIPPNLQVLAPTDAFAAFLKIGIIAGLILAMPLVLHQIWRFVATGLYPRERRFVKLLVPASLGLFMVGVVFFYLVVLPIVLQFFIHFNQSFGITPPVPAALLQRPENGQPSPAPTGDTGHHLKIPIPHKDPKDAQPGDVWFNPATRRLMVQTESGIWSTALRQGAVSTTMQSQFAIDYYISFVLVLALAFGIAFETPIVVFFLAWSGIVPTATMMKGRRYILVGVLLAAAILTPPDVISQLLLAVPMYLLFELGILVARLTTQAK